MVDTIPKCRGLLLTSFIIVTIPLEVGAGTTTAIRETTTLSPDNCLPGFYCPEEEPILCLPGYFCPGGSISPMPCPPGHYCNSTGATSPTPCPPGHYCNSTGATSSSECPAGYYCPNTGTINFSDYPCPVGTYGIDTGAVSIDQCELCTPGYYCATPGQTQPTGPCSPGYYCTSGASIPTQADCPPGFYCVAGSVVPTPCPDGFYSDTSLLHECKVCPPGFYCETGSVTPTLCPQGFVCPNNTGQYSMVLCPDWTYGSTAGLSEASQCTSCLESTTAIIGDVTSTGEMLETTPVDPAVSHRIVVDCGPPPNITSGTVQYTCTKYNNPAQYSCDVGFYLNGIGSVYCDTNGYWSPMTLDEEVNINWQVPECLSTGSTHGTTTDGGDRTTTVNSDITTGGNERTTSLGEMTTSLGDMTTSVSGMTSSVSEVTTVPDEITTSRNDTSDVTIDCGLPPGIRNGNCTLLGGTTYGSIALYSCYHGYHVTNGNNVRQCSADKVWTGTVGICIPTVCSDPGAPVNGTVTYDTPVIFNTKAVFICNEGYSVIGYSSVTCLPPGIWSKPFPTCGKVPAKACSPDIDRHGTVWNQTVARATISIDCPGQLVGNISRNCTADGIWRSPQYTCVKAEIIQATEKIDAVIGSNTTSEIKTSVVTDVLTVLLNSTISSVSGNDRILYDGEIAVCTETLEKVAEVSSDIVVTEQQSKDFLETASNLLNPENSEAYQTLQEGQANTDVSTTPGGADRVLAVIGAYANAIASSIHSLANETKRVIVTDNLEMTVSELADTDTLWFPADSVSSAAKLSISSQFLRGATSYAGVLYHNLSGLMTTGLSKGGQKLDSYEINTPVLALQLFNTSTSSRQPFEISLNFNHFTNNYNDPTCSFWNYSEALWDTTGCKLVTDMSTDASTVCSCDHLTNFAVLMNPFETNNIDTLALSIITLAGCSFSAICLAITLGIHATFWRHLKSDRAALLVNLSAALVVSYIVFLAGVEQTGNKTACAAIAVLLHYIYLVVFVLMLSEGIEIMVTVVYVFPMQSRLKWLLIMSWGLPAIIVAISMGATQLDGYGTDEHCWLSVDGGTIWAFVGPALAIIVVNLVQLLLVMQRMFTVKSVKARSKFRKMKTGIRCLCVLLPLIGCTWVIGVFYVNEDMAWIQYVFAALNSLQGFVIMLFHCVLNPQVQNTISKRWSQYKSTTASYTARSNSNTCSNRSDSVGKSGDYKNQSGTDPKTFADIKQSIGSVKTDGVYSDV